MRRILTFVLVAALVAGCTTLASCATTKTETSWTDDAGTITYKGKATAIFPARVDKSATSMTANGEGKNPWRIKSGQNAQGIDATEGLGLFESFMQMFQARPAAAPVAPTP